MIYSTQNPIKFHSEKTSVVDLSLVSEERIEGWFVSVSC